MQPITHSLAKSRNRQPNAIGIKFKRNKTWESITWPTFYSECENLANYLIDKDIDKGDRVAIISNTRYEWALCDMSVLGIGAVTVPIYQSNTAEDIEYILNNSETKILFCENDEQYKKWLEIKDNCPTVERVILFDTDIEELALSSILTAGGQIKESFPKRFEENCLDIELDQMATIIYTSGTTGRPKGVVLNHKQIMSEITEVFALLNLSERDCSLSFLPYAHVMGRLEMWASVHMGFTLAFAESIEKIKYNLTEIKPTFLGGVPRIFEKIYNGVIAQAETSKLKSQIFHWALSVGREVSQCKRNKKPIPPITLIKYKAAQELVFNKLKIKMGGRLRFAISGGAPLAKEIAEFFHAADLLVLEGYGLTETTGAITLNSPLHYKFGSVGKPIGEAQVQIADDGEVLVKSDKVMQGYYKNDEANAEVFEDGWFRTGDIGEIDSEGYLRITDRKKDLIKTAGGKYIAPQKLENLLKLNKFVSNVLIHGDQKKFVVALITLDEDAAKQFAAENNLSYSNYDSLTQNSDIRKLVKEAVAQTNSQLANYETIKNFQILSSDFSIETGELTPSLKVKRKFCDEKFKEVINSLYGLDQSSL